MILIGECTGDLSKRMPYASLQAPNGPVYCLGWPAGVRFRSHTNLTGYEYRRLVKALDEGKIKFVCRNAANDILANTRTGATSEGEAPAGNSTEATV